MTESHISLTQAEWSVMECLWEAGPLTGRKVTQHMEQQNGWSRSTTLTLLSRLEHKGAIESVTTESGPKIFSPPSGAGGRRPAGDGGFPQPGVSGEPEPDGQLTDQKAGHIPGGAGGAP